MNAATISLNDRIQTKRMTVWLNPFFQKRPMVSSVLGALGIHAVLFLVGGLIFNSAPEYGMQLSSGGIDIELVAAPLAAKNEQTSPVMQPPKENIASEKVDIPATEPTKHIDKPVSPSSAVTSKVTGDGSSAVVGKDATTLSSSGSGQANEKPGYLKNPPPPYPSEAIRKEQEGLVMLSVWVSRSGDVQKVEVEQSSGFALLDQSALKTVKKWKFNPARSGALAVESQVNIPVRFRLEDIRRSFADN